MEKGVLVVLLLVFVVCQSGGKKTGAELSRGQQTVQSAMLTAENKQTQRISLATELHQLFVENCGDEKGAASMQLEFGRALDSAALLLSSRLFMVTDPNRILDEMGKVIFTTWGIGFSEDRDSLMLLFPESVYRHRQGSCVGLSLLYLVLAEKMGIPLYAVLGPSHLFVRYDDGTSPINCETLRQGEHMSDAWYRTRFAIADTLRYTLANLNQTELMGIIYYNIGTSWLLQKKYQQSVLYLTKSAALLPNFYEAAGNRALALGALGKPEEALSVLNDLFSRYPQLENIDKNRAALLSQCGKNEDALTLYRKLLADHGDDPELQYGSAVVLHALQNQSGAETALQKALSLRSDYPEARELLATMRESVP